MGAGTIGHLTALVLAERGHEVTVFDRDSQRLSQLNGLVETETSLTGLDRFDWLVEATGDQSVLDTLITESATDTSLLLLGLPYTATLFSFESVVSFDRTIIGSVGSSSADFGAALEVLPRVDTAPFLAARYQLSEFEQAWSVARSRRHLKVMLEIDATTT